MRQRTPCMGGEIYSSDNDNDNDRTEKAIHLALKMGYGHFDTVKIYGSEPAVGNALRKAIEDDKIIPREDVFLTSKLWSADHHDPVSALKHTLRRVGMEYIDMYLVHWPVKLKPWACDAVPKCIDVSNFSTNNIQNLLDFASVPPAVNQVEMHPMWSKGGLGKAAGSTTSMMKENMASLDLKLDDDDLIEIDKLEERKIMRADFLVNDTTSPYRSLEDLWDYEI
ncbi:putative Ccr4-not transcription complex [Hibiscus syriacus]|uniref:Ccr4-not transcription complex n=1 Tax=Hibiscus syriacus TaxID=106335 RepID=A0A6A3AN21_HIBSY|nr:putative Ccr4-not transcription complex [Hibiscus syriacus]